jgi:hypothetical protein
VDGQRKGQQGIACHHPRRAKSPTNLADRCHDHPALKFCLMPTPAEGIVRCFLAGFGKPKTSTKSAMRDGATETERLLAMTSLRLFAGLFLLRHQAWQRWRRTRRGATPITYHSLRAPASPRESIRCRTRPSGPGPKVGPHGSVLLQRGRASDEAGPGGGHVGGPDDDATLLHHLFPQKSELSA